MSLHPRKLSLSLKLFDSSTADMLRMFADELDLLTVELAKGEIPGAESPDVFMPYQVISECKVHWLIDFSESLRAEVSRKLEHLKDVIGSSPVDGLGGFELRMPDMELWGDAERRSLLEVSEKAKAHGKEVSFRVPLVPGEARFDGSLIAECFDRVVIEGYPAYQAQRKGFEPFDGAKEQGIGAPVTAPLAEALLSHWSTVVAPEKLVFEIPTFSNVYSLLPGGEGRRVCAARPSVSDQAVEKCWLWFDKVHLYRYEDQVNGPELFYASDEASTRALLEVVSRHRVGMVSFSDAHLPDRSTWRAAVDWKQHLI